MASPTQNNQNRKTSDGAGRKKIVMKNRIQTAPVIRSDRNGRRTSPFSWRRTPRLTFVSCQPTRRRSRNPSFRGAGEYGADGTVGVGVHMGYRRPMPPSSFESSGGIPRRAARWSRGEWGMRCLRDLVVSQGRILVPRQRPRKRRVQCEGKHVVRLQRLHVPIGGHNPLVVQDSPEGGGLNREGRAARVAPLLRVHAEEHSPALGGRRLPRP